MKWIDFAALKRKVRIRDVLARYGYLEALTEKKPGKLVGPCPIHGGRNGTSFHVDTEKNVFNCFSRCGGGNVLDLVMKVEQCEIRDAGVKLASWFGLSFERNGRPAKPANADKSAAADHPSPDGSTEPVNPPLARPLSSLNYDHPYLFERGLTVETVKYFGAGFANRGIMRGRIAIPIHNEEGALVAYAGRAVDPGLAKEKGKYRLPNGFSKAHVVWNLNRARAHAERGLVVVEGFFDAMAVHQAGFVNVVALMGAQLSEHQERLLLEATDRLALMFDGDDAGEACLRHFYRRLRRKRYLRDIHLEAGEQPDSLPPDRLRDLLS